MIIIMIITIILIIIIICRTHRTAFNMRRAGQVAQPTVSFTCQTARDM